MRHSYRFGGLTKNRSHPLIPRQNERTKTIIDQSKTAASSASFLFGRDGLLSTQSLKNPNDVRTDRLTTCILSETGSYPLYSIRHC
ncbi:hypothetical protein Pst134EB_003627 [Puccinia striiformis f. sp. tritici]|nr:hypothetical protein Pst134EB_003627 [Puccinia striiformis f. sp. tritici]